MANSMTQKYKNRPFSLVISYLVASFAFPPLSFIAAYPLIPHAENFLRLNMESGIAEWFLSPITLPYYFLSIWYGALGDAKVFAFALISSITFLAVATGTWWLLNGKRLIARRRIARGLCPTCGYDCRHTTNLCPECGRGSAGDAIP
jgi:hypothetical protein